MGILTLEVGGAVLGSVRQEAGRTVRDFVIVQVRSDGQEQAERDSADTIQSCALSLREAVGKGWLWGEHCWAGEALCRWAG